MLEPLDHGVFRADGEGLVVDQEQAAPGVFQEKVMVVLELFDARVGGEGFADFVPVKGRGSGDD
jgi:hypothetical protein